jgi:hypothetical protein
MGYLLYDALGGVFGIFLEELQVSVEDSAAMVFLWSLYKDKAEGMCKRWEVFVIRRFFALLNI